MVASTSCELSRICPNSCSAPTAAELEMVCQGIDGPFLNGCQELLGIVPAKPDETFDAITLEMAKEGARKLAFLLGRRTKIEEEVPALARFLLLLQTFNGKPLDILTISHPGLIPGREAELCPGRCGRRNTGGVRWMLSVNSVLEKLLAEQPLRILARVNGTLSLELLRDGEVAYHLPLTATLFTAESGLLEISARTLELLRISGYRRLRDVEEMWSLVRDMVEQSKALLPPPPHEAEQATCEKIRRMAKRLRLPGLVIDGEPRAFANIYNTLHALREKRIVGYFAHSMV